MKKIGFSLWMFFGTCLLIHATAYAAADAYEPDNGASAAKTIANGQTQTRSIHAAGNVDWVKFSVGICGARNVALETSGASGDTQLWLYRGNGTLVAYDDNSGTGNFSRILSASLAPGAYFIKVQEYGNNGTIPAYTLKASWQNGDAWEPDNTAFAAKRLANGVPQVHSFHAATDVDWVKFTVGTAGARTVKIETSGIRGDTQMWLYGPNNATTPAAYDDDSGVGSFSRISLASLRPGTYFLKVQMFQGCGGPSALPSYTLKANWTSP